MTVESGNFRSDYVGNGSLTTYAVGFQALEDHDLQVFLTDPDDLNSSVEQILNTDYVVTGDLSAGTASVVFTVAPTTGTLIAILRNMPLTQGIVYEQYGDFPAKSHERALDKLTMITQEFSERFNRIPTMPEAIESTGLRFPAPVPGRAIVFNEEGTGLVAGEVSFPADLTGNSQKVVQVKTDESGLQYVSISDLLSFFNATSITVSGGITFASNPSAGGSPARISPMGNTGLEIETYNLSDGEYVPLITVNSSRPVLKNPAVNDGLNILHSSEPEAPIYGITLFTEDSDRNLYTKNTDGVIKAVLFEGDNPNALLTKNVNDLLSGSIEGSEGKRMYEGSVPVTLQSGDVATFETEAIGQVTTIEDSTQAGLPIEQPFGSLSNLSCQQRGYMLLDDGVLYECVYATTTVTEVAQTVCLHPKHGDVTAHVTPGNTYNVYLFKESLDPADKQVGELSMVEYFVCAEKLADSTAVDDLFSGDAYGVINPGYWQGKDWHNQVVDTLPGGGIGLGGTVACKLSRKTVAVSNSMVLDLLEVTNASGDFVQFSVAYPTVELNWSAHLQKNEFYVNTYHSWSVLGYTSEADMKQKAVFRATYRTNARRVRPIANPSGVKVLGNVWLNTQFAPLNGADLVYELIGGVPTGNGNPANMMVPLQAHSLNSEQAFTAVAGWEPQYTPFALASTQASSTCACLFGLYEYGGTLRIALWAKELVYDSVAGDWGDSGTIPIVDNVITTTDDNGNVVVVGCYEYDTGITV